MEVRALVEAPAMQVRAADPDAELVSAAQREPRAFLALYERYFERVLGYVRLRIRDESTCEDVASHVFTTALAHLSRFRGDGTFGGWLFQIARNAVSDVHRGAKDSPLEHDPHGFEPDAEERFLERERASELHVALKQLSAEQQHLLALRYGAGLAFDEIAGVLGASAGTVRVRLHRTLEDLRRRYPHDDR
jgi:RNA polymerase sigma-70 factor (ECF subfamily)